MASKNSSTSNDKTVAANPTVSAVDLKQPKFEVDPNGQATYRIPLTVAPGIAGAQPQLELVYNHRQGNGPLGVGWALSGMSAIGRTRPTYAVDGFSAPVSYGTNDRFTLSGQRLINVQGDYGAANTLYYTEIQSWRQVRAGASPNDGFIVTQKDGSIWKFGTTSDSRIMAAGGTGVRLWALSSTADRNGNTVEYSYTAAPLLVDGTHGTADEGGYYIDKISYTSNTGVAANRFVQFTYEPRPDPISDYVGGYPVVTSYRLARIDSSLTGNTAVRTYTLAYQQSTSTKLSQLLTITESNGADSLAPTKMVWQDTSNPGFDIGPVSTLNQHLNLVTVQQMDVTGGGTSDIVQLWVDQNNAINASTYLASNTGSGPTYTYASNSVLGAFPQGNTVLPMDVTGDGRTDLLIAYKGSNSNLRLAVFLSNGSGFDPAPGSPYDTGDSWMDTKHIQFFAMDANGDGRTDLVEAYSHYDSNQGNLLYFRTYLSQFGDGPGENFTDAIISATDDAATPTNVLAFWAMDVNADGMMDLVRVWKRGSDSHMIATAYISSGTSIDDVSFATQVESDLGTFSLATQKAFLPVDVNGNGVMDLLQVWQETTGTGTALHLTTFVCDAAGGFTAGPDTALPNRSIGQFYPMSFNGGGITSLVNKWISGDNKLMFTVYSASPSGRFWEDATFDAGLAGSAVQSAKFYPGDANGDGKADLIRMTVDQSQQVQILPYTSSGPYPNLVTSITNPLGGQTSIGYLPLTDPTVYSQSDPGSDDFPAGSGLRFPNPMTPTQYPVQAVLGQATYVVSGYTQTNDPTANRFAYSTAYAMSYTDALVDMTGRGWEGFATVSSLDLKSGERAVQTFNQAFPLTGTLASTATQADGTYATDPRVPKNQTAMLMSFSSTKYGQIARAAGVSGTNTQVFEVFMEASRTEQYNYGVTNFDYALGQTYGYDDFGNQSEHTQLGYVDGWNGQPMQPSDPNYPGKPLNSTEVVYRDTLYQNTVTASGWALGFPLFAKVSANATDTNIQKFLPGDYQLEQKTYTPTTNNLLTDGKWDNVNNCYLTTSYEYDAFGNTKTETKPGNFVTRYDYDPDYNTFRMRMTSPPNAQGVSLVTQYGCDPRFGTSIAQIDANNAITTSALDGFGRVTIQQGPIPPGGVGDANALSSLVTGTSQLRQTLLAAKVVTLATTAFSDDGQQGPNKQVNMLQSFPTSTARDFTFEQTFVDGLGRERETYSQSGQSAGNIVALIDYDENDKVVSQSLPFFSASAKVSSAPHTITTQYDVLARPIVRNSPAGADGSQTSVTTWAYGAQQAVTVTNASGAAEAYVQVLYHHTYDGNDKVHRSIVPNDNNATTVFVYDPIARMTQSTDPATTTSPYGVVNSIGYDSLNRRTFLDNPDQNTTGNPNIKAAGYTYDAATGFLKQQTDAAGDVTSFTYDGLGRMLTKTCSDGRVFNYTYDMTNGASDNGMGRLGQVKSVVSGGATESQYDFAFDAYGNTVSSTLTVTGESDPFVTLSTFDPQKRLVNQTLPDNSQLINQYSYGRLINQSLDGAVAEYPLDKYNPAGKAGELNYGKGSLPGTGIVIDYTFNPNSLVYGESVTDSAGEVLNISYRYDLMSQILQIADQDSGQAQNFSYLNRRLQTANIPGFDPGAYGYDQSGNLTTKDGVDFTYQAHFPVTGKQGANTVYSATQDACGRTKTRTAGGQDLTFAYDGLGCLSRVTNGSGAAMLEVVSNYLGKRLRQTTADGTQVVHVNSYYQVSHSPQGATTTTKYLVNERGSVASITTTTARSIVYFRLDHKGSTTHTFGSAGTVVSQAVYSGYGQFKLVTGPDDFAPKYEQRSFDTDIGLYYFGARYYDPMTGRFLTPDSQLGGDNYLVQDVLNRFAFELNNPINNIDPTGHSSAWIAGLVAGLIIVAIGAAIVLTGGAATPLGAVVAGAVLGAGLNASIYSVTHRDQDWGTFTKGWLADAAVGALIGGVTGGISYGAGLVAEAYSTAAIQGVQNGVRAVSFIARSMIYVPTGMAMGAAGDAFNQFMSNVIDRDIGGDKDLSLSEGVNRAAATGAIFGMIAGFGQAAGEAARLRTTYRMGSEILDTEPTELTSFASGASRAPVQSEAYTIERAVENTIRTRAILFGITETAAVMDASLEAAGL